LGSVDVITSSTGAVLERDSFDAWGFRRTTDWQSQRPIGSTSIVSRGFTDHEELDSLGLVNMNGRVYDPGIGRFLSADPFIQFPAQTQSFNRYSYVLNNPLSFTDPSGFNIFGNFFNWMNKTFGRTGTQIIIGVVAIAAGIVTAGAFTAVVSAILAPTWELTALGASIVGGAGFGFGAGFTGSILSGASIGQAFQAGLIGGAIGAVSGGFAHELGLLNKASEFFSWGHLGQTIGHAILGGASSEIQHGDWEEGALAGAVNGAFGPLIDQIGNRSLQPEYIAERVAAAAVLGGTAAELGGGKFANGAITAAFLRLYNEEKTMQEVDRLRREAADAARAPSDPMDRAIALYRNHVGGSYDFVHNASNDTFNVDGTIMNAHEFGNYIAGFASYAALGDSGVTFMHMGGDGLHFLNHFSFDDANSFRLIELGASDAINIYGLQASWHPLPRPIITGPLFTF
jgi:RHS repeat-associated protein